MMKYPVVGGSCIGWLLIAVLVGFGFVAAAPSARAVTNVAATLAGDFNGDNTVGAADYVVWRRGLDTIYTQADYDVLAGTLRRNPTRGRRRFQ